MKSKCFFSQQNWFYSDMSGLLYILTCHKSNILIYLRFYEVTLKTLQSYLGEASSNGLGGFTGHPEKKNLGKIHSINRAKNNIK